MIDKYSLLLKRCPINVHIVHLPRIILFSLYLLSNS